MKIKMDPKNILIGLVVGAVGVFLFNHFKNGGSVKSLGGRISSKFK
jgi:hypothetical protein